MTIENGGPAFPVQEIEHVTFGMTLRDLFAGQALIQWGRNSFPSEVIAEKCYSLADAMIAERSK